jgi:hypothetical protein
MGRSLTESAAGAVEAGAAGKGSVERRITSAILDVIGSVPRSSEVMSDTPERRAAALARRAAQKAAGLSGGAALVPGPFGLLSLLPDILGVWRLQAQLVADIAAVYGRTATLGSEQMAYCLFKHLFSHGLRDIVVRTGERYLVRQASLRLLQTVAAVVGVKVTQRALGKAIARYAPLVGALGVGAYAFYDTKQVAKTAIALFGSDIVIELAAVETTP